MLIHPFLPLARQEIVIFRIVGPFCSLTLANGDTTMFHRPYGKQLQDGLIQMGYCCTSAEFPIAAQIYTFKPRSDPTWGGSKN